MGIELAYPGLTHLIQQDRVAGFTDSQILRNIAREVEDMRKRGVKESKIDEWLGVKRGVTEVQPPSFTQQVMENSIKPALSAIAAPVTGPMGFMMGGFEEPGAAVGQVFKNAVRRGTEAVLGQPFGPRELYEKRTGEKAGLGMETVDALAYSLMPAPAALGGSIAQGLRPKPIQPNLSREAWIPNRKEILDDLDKILADSISEAPRIGTKTIGELQMGTVEKKMVNSDTLFRAFSKEYVDTHTPMETALELMERFNLGMRKSEMVAAQLHKANQAGLLKPAELAKPLRGASLTEMSLSDEAVKVHLARLSEEYKKLKAEGWWKRKDVMKKNVLSIQEYEQKLKESGFDVSKVSMSELGLEELARLREQPGGVVAKMFGETHKLIGSPYKIARDVKEQYLWLILDEQQRDYHKFLRFYADRFLKATKGVKKGSQESLEAGWWLDKTEAPQFSSEKARELYNDFRQLWKETGELAVERGLFKKEDLKEGYFHRMWSRIADKGEWERQTVDDIVRLKMLKEDAMVGGKEFTKEQALQLNQAEDALKRMRAGEVRVFYDYVPTKIFAPFTMERKGGQGYQFDAVTSMYYYLNDFARKIYLEPAAKKALALVDSIDDAGQRSYWKHIIQRYMDLPVRESAYIRTIDDASRAATTLEFIKDMGLSMRSVIMNGSQHFNTLIDVGPGATGKAIAALIGNKKVPGYEKTARELFYDSGHALDLPWDWERMKQTPDAKKLGHWLNLVQDYAGAPFQMVEKGNRAVAYVAGLFDAAEKGLVGEAARRYADAVVKRNQYLYGKTGAFMGQTGPVGRVAFQFSTFPIKTMELYHTWAKEGPGGLAKLLSHVALSSMIVHGGTQYLGMDLSYMFGLGVNPHEMYKAVNYLAQGDKEKSWMQAKVAAAPFVGNVGGTGILPSGIAPFASTMYHAGKAAIQFGDKMFDVAFSDSWDEAISHLKDSLGTDAYRLMPLQVARLYETARALSLGETVEQTTGEKGYPFYKVGDRKRLDYVLTPYQVALQTVGPKAAAVSHEQKEDFKDRIFDKRRIEAAREIVKLSQKGDVGSMERARKLREKYGIDDADALINKTVEDMLGKKGRRALREGTKGGAIQEYFFSD